MKLAIFGINELSNAIAHAACGSGIDCTVYDTPGKISGCDAVIINTPEELDARRRLACEIDAQTEMNCVIALTSTLSYISGMAQAVRRYPNRVLGLRFMGPSYVDKYAEITKSFDSDDFSFKKMRSLLSQFCGNVVQAPDVIGGIFYRLLPIQANMAAYLVSEGVTPEDVDNSLIYGTNTKRAPLHIADEIGLDILLAMLERIFDETGRPAYRPCPLLRRLVSAGRLGKKSGIGFFDYRTGGNI